ncbi:unnamed protein product, partial [Pylaiella littoralis]
GSRAQWVQRTSPISGGVGARTTKDVLTPWRMLIEPSKYPLSEADLLFSKRLESVRKDVECFFGILKMRFRILKLAMTYQKQERLDYVFFTCCILHNMLHTHDGMGGLEEDVNWVGSAELQNTSGHNLDS